MFKPTPTSDEFSDDQKKYTTAPQFIKAYLDNGCDYQLTAEHLGLTKAAVYQRVLTMRKRGVKLPIAKHKRVPQYSVTELNQMIKNYKNNK